MLEHRARLQAEREQLEGVEDDIARLEEEQRRPGRPLPRAGQALSARRAAAAERFSARVVEVLKGLGIPRARLRLALGARGPRPRVRSRSTASRVEPAADGIDVGEFELSTNPGEELRSMARIASGGELSRIHLAMRTVLRDSLPRRGVLTLLFDEVDAGIGGNVADELGELLAALGDAGPGAGGHPPARRWPAAPPRTSWCARRAPGGAP